MTAFPDGAATKVGTDIQANSVMMPRYGLKVGSNLPSCDCAKLGIKDFMAGLWLRGQIG
jgi:hypothetical protein